MGRRSLVSRRASSFETLVSPVDVRESYLIRIATEGENTEYRFFTQSIVIHEKLSNRIKINVLQTTNGLSAPEHVWERLEDSIKKDQDLGNMDPADQYWLVVDVDDHAHLEQTLCKIKEYNRNGSIRIDTSVSNPCFEVWLALYGTSNNMNKYPVVSLEEMVKEVDDHYTKHSFNATKFQNHRWAISRAKKLKSDMSVPVPSPPGTRVYLLVEQILKVIKQVSAHSE